MRVTLHPHHPPRQASPQIPTALVRKKLRCTRSFIDDVQLRRLWLHLDVDRSECALPRTCELSPPALRLALSPLSQNFDLRIGSLIDVGEFGTFMRVGKDAVPKGAMEVGPVLSKPDPKRARALNEGDVPLTRPARFAINQTCLQGNPALMEVTKGGTEIPKPGKRFLSPISPVKAVDPTPETPYQQ